MSMETLQPEAGDDRHSEIGAQRLHDMWAQSEPHADMPLSEMINERHDRPKVSRRVGRSAIQDYGGALPGYYLG